MTGKRYTLKQASDILEIPYKDRIYSVKDAARRLKISDSHCRRLLEQGKIKGKKLGHDWIVLGLEYKRKRRPKGGQSGEKS
jgi:excisionase family DNA binding protein